MGKIIFSELSKSYESILRKLDTLERGSDAEVLERLRYRIYKEELLPYVNGLSYLKSEDTKNRVSLFKASGYDYKSTADKLETTVGALQVCISTVSKKVRDKIGDDCLNAIDSAKSIDELRVARRLLRTRIGITNIGSVIPTYIAEVLKLDAKSGEKIIPFNFDDCVNEIKFFQRYSNLTFKQDLKGLNIDKLRFIYNRMTGVKSSQSLEAMTLLSWLNGDISCSFEELLEKLNYGNY